MMRRTGTVIFECTTMGWRTYKRFAVEDSGLWHVHSTTKGIQSKINPVCFTFCSKLSNLDCDTTRLEEYHSSNCRKESNYEKSAGNNC